MNQKIRCDINKKEKSFNVIENILGKEEIIFSISNVFVPDIYSCAFYMKKNKMFINKDCFYLSYTLDNDIDVSESFDIRNIVDCLNDIINNEYYYFDDYEGGSTSNEIIYKYDVSDENLSYLETSLVVLVNEKTNELKTLSINFKTSTKTKSLMFYSKENVAYFYNEFLKFLDYIFRETIKRLTFNKVSITDFRCLKVLGKEKIF